ncbi:class III aminotransferase [Mycolicibacterium mucogenicum]|uniref:Class III aminotransferase n=1 Tax=Mycolicibacterium mucogenicum TaxID=56689 RepID=A0A1A3HB22_MYCMU|nr:aminotransferase class III-fold pyridoxal phosphate-dependent enzyme [Mycolicibacterium mucogenicum]OBJ44813.1 class III aminotransferase [Mycolicibacterium mucogenicum]
MASNSSKTYARALGVLPGGNTRATTFVRPHPPYAAHGKGCRVTDTDGRTVIDCNNNYTSLIHGHADPHVLDAAERAGRQGTAFGLPTPYEVEMAEHLHSRTSIDHWRFCNSGTEAVMMLMRAARAYTGRDVVIRFEGSYHGTYEGVVNPVRAPGIPESTYQSIVVVPQHDLAALEEAMARIGSRVAAVLIDLVPNRAGMVPAEHQYLARLREITTEYGALLAIDEVISFRLAYGGFHQTYGVSPDLVSLAKIIGGGYPVGAIGGPREILDSFNPLHIGHGVSWGGTFSANPVTLAAGLEAMRRFDAAAIDRLNEMGDRLRKQLAAAGVWVRGHGSLIRLGMEDPQTGWWSLYSNGVLASSNGMMSLSTPMTDDDLEAITAGILRSEGVLREDG